MFISWPLMLFVISIVGSFFVVSCMSLVALTLDQEPLPARLRSFGVFWARYLIVLVIYAVAVWIIGYRLGWFYVPLDDPILQ
jgi:hypothetical protein